MLLFEELKSTLVWILLFQIRNVSVALVRFVESKKIHTCMTDYSIFSDRKSAGRNTGTFVVRLAAHVSNGLKSRIRPVVGRI